MKYNMYLSANILLLELSLCILKWQKYHQFDAYIKSINFFNTSTAVNLIIYVSLTGTAYGTN